MNSQSVGEDTDRQATDQPTSDAEMAPRKGAKSRKSDRQTSATGNVFKPLARGRHKGEQPAASDAKPGANASVVQLRQRGETASERVARLKREISAAEADKSGIEQAITTLAIECEAGDAEALAKRTQLRAELATCTDRIGDKQAALAAAEPLAAVEQHREAIRRRDAAFDQARQYADYWTGWAEQADRCVTHLIEAFKHMQACERAVLAATQFHLPASGHWLLEVDQKTLENVILARLVRAGLVDADEFDPGPLYSGNETLGATIAQHTDNIRDRLAAAQAQDRIADRNDIIAQSSGSVWDPPSANRPHRFTHTIGPAIQAAFPKG